MAREHLFYLENNRHVRCHSKGRACGDRDQSKFHNQRGLPGDKPTGTLHHMVPWGQLWRVLETAFQEVRADGEVTVLSALLPLCYSHTRIDGHARRLASAITALGRSGDRLGATVKNRQELYVDTSEGFSSNDSEVLAGLSADDALYDLVNHWCWMPGNLFLGSSTRSDDPGDFGFDHPPMDVKRHAANTTETGVTSFENRVSDLFELYQFLRRTSDQALATEARAQLVSLLDGLVHHRLWSPYNLTQERLGTSFVPDGKRYKVAKPMILSEAMRQDYEERLAVLAPPFNGDYAKYVAKRR